MIIEVLAILNTTSSHCVTQEEQDEYYVITVIPCFRIVAAGVEGQGREACSDDDHEQNKGEGKHKAKVIVLCWITPPIIMATLR